MQKVAVVQAESYDINVVAQAMAGVLAELGGMEKFIQPGDRVLIKPNILDAVAPDKAVTTHPEVVRAVIRQVKAAGGQPVVGDSPGVTTTYKAAAACGILAVCEQENVPLTAFTETAVFEYPQGQLVKRFSLAAQLASVDKVISVAKMKTHTFMGITGATKNLFGLVVGMEKAQFHFRMQARREFAALLLDLAGVVCPTLSIVDGIVGMEGNGPRGGQPKACGVLLAGRDYLRVDAVMAAMMGFAVADLPLLSLAMERRLLPPLAQIAISGDAAGRTFFFVPPRSLKSLEDAVPRWAARLAKDLLTARPAIVNDDCIGCSRCIQHCPAQAMTLVDAKAVIHQAECIRCYCCQEHCPYGAVVLEERWLLRLVQLFHTWWKG